MVSAPGRPDGRPHTVAADQPAIDPGELDTSVIVDVITTQLRHTAGVMREVHDEVDAQDPSTSDLLHTIINQLEKQTWILSSENRVHVSR